MSFNPAPNVEPIPGYRLIERLGRGGFGEVWKAEAPGGLLKAIKFIYCDHEITGDGEPAKQERKSLERIKSIRHPYILSLERIEEVDGTLMIVMELADRNLWDRYRDSRAQGHTGIPREELLRYMEEAAEALDLMNSQHQLQHLDIKPQNLFLVYNHIKVADFGLVKDLEGLQTRVTGGVTPVYAAPETFDGFVSRQSDQYSLAIVYQEVLTGQRPFNGSSARRLMLQHLQEAPDVSPLPETDRALINRALSKKPEDRFPMCTDLVQALRQASMTQTVPRMPNAVPIPEMEFGDAPQANATMVAMPTPAEVRRTQFQIPRRMDTPARPANTQGRSSVNSTQMRAGLQPLPLPDGPQTIELELGTGVLFPVLIVGLGGVGCRVLQQFRATLQQAFGEQMPPHLRLIAMDTDPDAIRELTGHKSRPLESEHVYHASLNRPSYYLKGDGPAGVDTWLGASTLYLLPKNPAAASLRAFGRLAFCDHAAALARRFRSDLEAARHPPNLAASDQMTGLGVRSMHPRVYVVAGLGGGTGSGMFIDVAYMLRSTLRQMGTAPNLTGVFLLPPAERRSAGEAALANAYASLAELRYFSESGYRYETRRAADGTIQADPEAPFRRSLFLPLASAEKGPEADLAIGQASGWLHRELLTCIGRVADREREAVAGYRTESGVTALTATTFTFNWPRERLVRQAGRRLGLALMEYWSRREITPAERDHVKEDLEAIWDQVGLNPEPLVKRLHDRIVALNRTAPADDIEEWVGELNVVLHRGDRLESRIVYKVVDKIIRLLGPPDGYSAEDGLPGHLQEIVDAAGSDVAQEVEQQVARCIMEYLERPRRRIVGAEEMVRQIAERSKQVLAAYDSLSDSLRVEGGELFRKLFPMISGLDRFALTAKRRDQHVQEVITLLREFPKRLYQGVLARGLKLLYRGIIGSVPDYLREVHYCRERLNEAERLLELRTDAEPDLEPAFGPGVNLLPDGGHVLDEAARDLVRKLTLAEHLEFDTRVQAAVNERFRSMVGFCLDTGPKPEQMTDLLETAGAEFFGPRLAKTTPVDALLALKERPGQLETLFNEAQRVAHPPLAGPKAAIETMITILGAPTGPAGQKLRNVLDSEVPEFAYLPAETKSEVLIYRELRSLDLSALPQFGPIAREAYRNALVDTQNPPHSRLDISWEVVST